MEETALRALGLLDALYAAALGQAEEWTTFLEHLRIAMNGDVGVLALIGTREPTAEFIAQSNVPESMQRDYAERFVAIDPWPAAFRASGLPLGRNGCSQNFVSMQEFARTEYYNEFWRPNGDLFHTCGGFFAVDEAHIGMLATPRSRRRRPFSSRHAALMDMVSPHVGRALQFRQRLARAESAQHDLETVLDTMGDGLLLLDATSRILLANHAADAELASRRCISSKSGHLSAVSPDGDAELQAAIRATAATSASVAIACPAPLALRIPGTTVVLTCFPIATQRIQSTRFPPGSRVLVTITGADKPARGLAHLLRALYHLTPTEALLVECLAEGDDLDTAAQRLHMTKGTARIHLRHVFLKTDTKRQAQLVALVHRIAPMAFLKP